MSDANGFLWGVSTSSYQIEGAAREDGRGPSIWDSFSRTPGKVLNGDTGDVACDHYHRYAEDVALMKRLGVDVYRFSIAWPRVFPEGTGKLNPAGLDFYDRVVDAALAAGIDPWACLYHWDLPQALEDRGGWRNRDVASWFVDYAMAVADRLGDRVKSWAMLNEPSVISWIGNVSGLHAPGLKDADAFFANVHHLNLAQGAALKAMRARDSGWRLGTVLNLLPAVPAGPGDEACADLHNAVWNEVFLDPLFRSAYPARVAERLAPYVKDGDLETARQTIDFLGVNYYSRAFAKTDASAPLGYVLADPPMGSPVTAMGWEVHPGVFRDTLLWLAREYGNPPVYVTENGAAYPDALDADGRVRDSQRIAYFDSHVAAVLEARAQGADLRGYFAWSLLDNFEWHVGYDARFGLVYVDYATQKRIPKDSFAWLQARIARSRAEETTGASAAGA